MKEESVNPPAGLRLEGIKKAYDGKEVLCGVDLEVREGGFTVLLGESGCGKTTLLRIAAGFERADAGKIYVCGRDVTNVKSGERGVRTVPQSAPLFPHMSAAGNITFDLRARPVLINGKMRRMSAGEARARAEEILSVLGLEGMGSRRASTLSGGERQRVAIARAAACGAKVILLDEPMSALDGMSRDSLREWLGGMHEKTGVTVLCVTHDSAEAMRTGDEIAIMSGGRIVRCGSPEEVYRFPRGYEAARLTGESGRLRGVADGVTATFKCGARVECALSGGVEAYVRAEDAEICDDGEVTGRVKSCAFCGDGYMTEILTESGELVARADKKLAAGDEVKLKVRITEVVKA